MIKIYLVISPNHSWFVTVSMLNYICGREQRRETLTTYDRGKYAILIFIQNKIHSTKITRREMTHLKYKTNQPIPHFPQLLSHSQFTPNSDQEQHMNNSILHMGRNGSAYFTTITTHNKKQSVAFPK